MTTRQETREFQAETQKLLDLMIHSLYSSKEIFLRELISNASDALDRRRIESLTHPDLEAARDDMEIRLEVDAEARRLTVSDNGIGMSREELIENIGTIAHSGTKKLLEKLEADSSKQAVGEMIGQFGVGFYSTFMVADKVTLVTRRAGEDVATRWESAGDGKYTVSPAERDQPGTSITLDLKPSDPEAGVLDFTQEQILRQIVKRYSDYISYPVKMKIEKQVPSQLEKGETVSEIEDQTLNSMKPIWMHSPSEVEEKQYADFYHRIAFDFEDPLISLPLKAEGVLEYRALLFVPARPPMDLYARDAQRGLQLYVKRVLIMEACDKLLPEYLRFIRGVVDSTDLPLNVSREMAQHDRELAQMRRWLTRKVLERLAKLADEDSEKYTTFWESFGAVLKEGLASDMANRDRLLPLSRFRSLQSSSGSGDRWISLTEYKEQMKEGQGAIYYLTGESFDMLAASPHLEAFRDKGIDVLLLTDPVDEFFVQSVTEFDGCKLVSAAKGDLDLDVGEGDASEEEEKEDSGHFGPFVEFLQEKLSDKVKGVRISKRLTTSPACLIGDEGDLSPRMQRWLSQNSEADAPKRILEINAGHAVLSKLRTRFEADRSDPLLDEYSQLLYDYALLAEGAPLPDPARFALLLSELMVKAL